MLNNSKQLTYIIKKIINENYKRILLKEEGDAGLSLPGNQPDIVEEEGDNNNPPTPAEADDDLLDQGVESPDAAADGNTEDQDQGVAQKVELNDTTSQPTQPTNQPTTDTTESITSLKVRFFPTSKSNKDAELVNLKPGQMKIEFRQPIQSTAAGQGQIYTTTTQPNVDFSQITQSPINKPNN